LVCTERKTGKGYNGFDVCSHPSVTLEEDLARRDFTVNAMASDGARLIDPFHGAEDLKQKVLRHVGPAFAEDPVRVLRAARFVARFGFTVATETMDLMTTMVENGEVDALTQERVWKEISRAMMVERPSLFFLVLRECGALKRVLPEVDALFGIPQPIEHHPEGCAGTHTMMVLDSVAREASTLEARFAALVHDLGKALTPAEKLPKHHDHEKAGVPLVNALCDRLRVPNECRELALLVTEHHLKVHRAEELKASSIVKLFTACDVWRKPERFAEMLGVCRADQRGRAGREMDDYPPARILSTCAGIAREVDCGAVARGCGDNKKLIPERIHEARVLAVKRVLGEQ
jgi:tRNA nucleotidyltransferase (CCA-adding enzyme)